MAAVPCDSTTFLFRYVSEQRERPTDRQTRRSQYFASLTGGGKYTKRTQISQTDVLRTYVIAEVL